MALTYSPVQSLGVECPDFDLPSVDGQRFSKASLARSNALVVMFLCNHCPYVRAVEDRLLSLAREFSPRGVNFVAICSNDSSDHPEDRPEALLQRWREKKYPFPYLIDESQHVARAFGAVCTPDFFVYDGRFRLSYRGRLDDSWRNPNHVLKSELRQALEDILAQRPVEQQQNPSMGCSIKWKAP